jgi:hypothetical protein
MEALGVLGFVLLLAHVAADLALVGVVVRSNVLRGAIALVLPPLAVLWAWQLGAKRRVMAYGATLVAFTLVVTLAALT